MNIDFSILRVLRLTELMRQQFSAESAKLW
jgi:hypothetical protein